MRMGRPDHRAGVDAGGHSRDPTEAPALLWAPACSGRCPPAEGPQQGQGEWPEGRDRVQRPAPVLGTVGGGQQRRSGGSGVPPSPLGAQGAVAGATQPLCCACVAALWTPGFTEGAAPTGRAAGALTPPHPPWASPPHGSSAQRSSQAWPLPEPSSCPRGHWEGPRKLMGPQKEGPTLHLQGRRRPSWEV